MKYTAEQTERLLDLGALRQELGVEFSSPAGRNSAYQEQEARLAEELRRRLLSFSLHERRPHALALEEKLSALLRAEGFMQVHTPIIMARARLEKMGVRGTLMENQVFWIDARRCLRPMLAPHLYEYMKELGRQLPRPLRLFECGPCFRRETEGTRHANEFTMLNLVEMGLPDDVDKKQRLGELAQKMMDAAGIQDWSLLDEDSAVYGRTLDIVNADGLELASSAIGPLPMDSKWEITENWLGIGFGLERLSMAALHEPNLARTGRSLSCLNGIRVRL